MRIDLPEFGKADNRLQDALAAATGPESLRVLVSLRADDRIDQPPSPADFSNYADYRRELIQRRKQHLDAALAKAIHALVALGVRVNSDGVSKTVVADGTAEQVAAALGVPGVERIYLDRQAGLIRPVPSRTARPGSG